MTLQAVCSECTYSDGSTHVSPYCSQAKSCNLPSRGRFPLPAVEEIRFSIQNSAATSIHHRTEQSHSGTCIDRWAKKNGGVIFKLGDLNNVTSEVVTLI